MKARLCNYWDALRNGFWFVPSLMLVGGFLFLLLARTFDASDYFDSERSSPLWNASNEAARESIATILGAMISAMGAVFSITMLILSMASQQFGPRLLRTFRFDSPTQITFGLFLTTSGYCIIALWTLSAGDPKVGGTLTGAMSLCLLSLFCLIWFIHHVANSIQVNNVVSRIGAELDLAIERNALKDTPEQGSTIEIPKTELQTREVGEIHVAREGYIQSIDAPGMITLAKEYGLKLEFTLRPGDFAARGATLARAHTTLGHNLTTEQTESLHRCVNGAVIVGTHRTPRQDIACALDEIVEIALRALSPANNDPMTAVLCVDRLGAALGRYASQPVRSDHFADEDGCARLTIESPSFAELVDGSLGAVIRHATQSKPLCIHLIAALDHIRRMAQSTEYMATIQKAAEQTHKLATRISEQDEDLSLAVKSEELLHSIETRQETTNEN